MDAPTAEDNGNGNGHPNCMNTPPIQKAKRLWVKTSSLVQHGIADQVEQGQVKGQQQLQQQAAVNANH